MLDSPWLDSIEHRNSNNEFMNNNVRSWIFVEMMLVSQMLIISIQRPYQMWMWAADYSGYKSILWVVWQVNTLRYVIDNWVKNGVRARDLHIKIWPSKARHELGMMISAFWIWFQLTASCSHIWSCANSEYLYTSVTLLCTSDRKTMIFNKTYSSV